MEFIIITIPKNIDCLSRAIKDLNQVKSKMIGEKLGTKIGRKVAKGMLQEEVAKNTVRKLDEKRAEELITNSIWEL